MRDSNVREHLEEKHERDRERRIEAIKRWVDYIETEPVETWGPQQNAVVDGQLEAAQHARTSAAHRQHLTDVADEIMDAKADADDDPD